jgi:DNA-binding transcriptional LysR family regulator
VTTRGEQVAQELRELLKANDRAVQRLLADERPFVLGAVEHFVDPLIPKLLRTLGKVQLRVDRSQHLVDAVAAGEVDAAIVVDPGRHPDPQLVGELTLRWHSATGTAPSEEPLGVVAYTAPCSLRTLSLHRLDQLGLATYIAAESPHLSGIQTAVRNGLGVALLAAAADGIKRIDEGPLTEPMTARLWLVTNQDVPAVTEALRDGLARSSA